MNDVGWICDKCGSENDFSLTHCRVCNAAVEQRFIRRERLRTQAENRRYQIRIKRREAWEQGDFSSLCRRNRIACIALSLLVLAGSIGVARPALSSPAALRAGASAAVSAAEDNARKMGEAAAARLTEVAGRYAASGNQQTPVLAGRRESIVRRAAQLADTARANRSAVKEQLFKDDRATGWLAIASHRIERLRALASPRIEGLKTGFSVLDSPAELWRRIVQLLQSLLRP